MMRLFIRHTLRFTLFFAVVIGAICLQPYDDNELRAFLFPDDCAVACIMGIEPGVTTYDEAAAILSEHEWVYSWNYVDERHLLSWEWKHNFPYMSLGLSSEKGYIYINNRDIITDIRSDTSIPLYQYLLILNAGLADLRYDHKVTGIPADDFVTGVYQSDGLLLLSPTFIICPPDLNRILGGRTEIIVSTAPPEEVQQAQEIYPVTINNLNCQY